MRPLARGRELGSPPVRPAAPATVGVLEIVAAYQARVLTRLIRSQMSDQPTVAASLGVAIEDQNAPGLPRSGEHLAAAAAGVNVTAEHALGGPPRAMFNRPAAAPGAAAPGGPSRGAGVRGRWGLAGWGGLAVGVIAVSPGPRRAHRGIVEWVRLLGLALDVRRRGGGERLAADWADRDPLRGSRRSRPARPQESEVGAKRPIADSTHRRG